MEATRLLGALALALVAVSCRAMPQTADAAELARGQLQKEGIEQIQLTPTSDEGEPFLFQVEGERGGKRVAGAAEVSYQEDGSPGVSLNLFEVPSEERAPAALTAQNQ